MRTLSKAEMKAVSAGQCYDQYGQGSYSCGSYVPYNPVPPAPAPAHCVQYGWIGDNYSGYYSCVKWSR